MVNSIKKYEYISSICTVPELFYVIPKYWFLKNEPKFSQLLILPVNDIPSKSKTQVLTKCKRTTEAGLTEKLRPGTHILVWDKSEDDNMNNSKLRWSGEKEGEHLESRGLRAMGKKHVNKQFSKSQNLKKTIPAGPRSLESHLVSCHCSVAPSSLTHKTLYSLLSFRSYNWTLQKDGTP